MSGQLDSRLFDTFIYRHLFERIMQGDFLSEKEILDLSIQADGFWQYDYEYQGTEIPPHGSQRNLFHSDEYIWSSQLLSYPGISTLLAMQLIMKIKGYDISVDNIDWVIGSPYGITFSNEVARLVRARHGFTEMTDAKTSLKKFDIKPNHRVLLIDDLTQTHRIITEQIDALTTAIGEPVQLVPVIGVVYNASMTTSYKDMPIISLVHRPIKFWTPEECPLCRDKHSLALNGEECRLELMKTSAKISI